LRKYLPALIIGCGISATANAGPLHEIIDAYHHANTALLTTYLDTSELLKVKLAKGFEYALKGNNDRAAEQLQQVLASPDLAVEDITDLLRDLSNIQFRQGHYRAAGRTLAAMLKNAVRSESTEDDFQSWDIYRALADVPATKVIAAHDGKTAIIRDAQNLPRISINVNNVAGQAVVDTDANTSVMMESMAKKLKMRIIGSNLKGSSSTSAIGVRFAVADHLDIAGTRYANVIFAVLPDSALTFAGGKYRIEAILGLPELVPLQCITFLKENKQENMSWSHDSACTTEGNELSFVGLTPVVQMQTKQPNINLSFELDTGANESNVQSRGVTKLAIKNDHLKVSEDHIGGAGKTVTEKNQHIDSLTLLRGEQEVELKNVTIRELHKPDEYQDGLLGQDILAAGKGYILDFVNMRIQWL